MKKKPSDVYYKMNTQRNTETCNFTKKEALTQVFSLGFLQIF